MGVASTGSSPGFGDVLLESGNMKVLIIAAAFPPLRAGDADHTLYLCQHLAARGLDIHVLTTRKEGIPGNLPFQVYPLMQNWTWSDVPRLAKFVKHCAPEAVLLMYSGWIYNNHAMITFVPTLTKLLLPGVHFVTQFEIDYLSRRFSLLTRAILKAIPRWTRPENAERLFFGTLLGHSDRLIVLSERHQAKFAESFPKTGSKTVVIPPPPLIRLCPENNGVFRQRGRRALHIEPDDFLLAYFGYIYASKGVDTLLRAFQIVSNQRSNVRLVMIGGSIGTPNAPSYPQEIYELSKTLGIADKVIWTGEFTWDNDQASVYLHAADACVLPFNEGALLNRSSLAAAAYHGLPIVTTKGMFLESPFIHQKNVLLCPPQDPQSLALAIDSLISNPELRQRLHIGALELAHEWFSWDKAVERTIEALKRDDYAHAK
jgi:glycosyltransferase involved in cell wall biosynthesis